MSLYWKDPNFKDKMLAFVCRDRRFLKRCSVMLSSDDFKPRGKESNERWIVADLALNYYEKYREPIKAMLKAECLDYAKKAHLSDRRRRHLCDFADAIQEETLEAVDAVQDKVFQYKKEQAKQFAIEELFDLQEKDQLTDDRFLEICQKAVETTANSTYKAVEIFNEVDKRIARRLIQSDRRFPILFIDPLDEKVRAISRGHVGMLIAPPKRGKTLGLIHISLAYALQGLKGLYFTLEDPVEDIEDRYDASISNLPIGELSLLPKKLKRRFERYKRLVRGNLKIIDGTEGGMSMRMVETIYEAERNKGFHADFIIVDYDDEIVPPRKHKDRRQEFSDIYREIRQFSSRSQVLFWTAAQTNRKKIDKKIITGEDLAEDYSKIRKVSFALGLGKGDWHPDNGVYVYVAAHRNDRQFIGWNILTDKTRMVFYDREATLKRRGEERRKKEKEKVA